MEIEMALELVRTLATGVNPVTSERFSFDSPYNHPDIVRALFTVLQRVPKPRKSGIARQKENVSRGLSLNAGMPWTDVARAEVAESYRAGMLVEDIAKSQERTKKAIVAELVRQQIISMSEGEDIIGGPTGRGIFIKVNGHQASAGIASN